MIRMDYFKTISQVLKDAVPAITSGIFTVVVLSCVLFGIQTYFNLTPSLCSIGATVFQNGHIHRLFIYPFYHRTFAQLLLSIAALVFLSGSLEKGVGTVRFLSLFLLMSTITGFFYSFLELLQEDDSRSHTEGLVPVALACVALTTMHTKMTKGFLCGVSFPTMALPWVFLIITTALIPHCVLPCNVIAILIGWMYGKGFFSLLDMSEARAGALEKMMPFRLLKSISSVSFVTASAEERRKTLLPQINPTPGSYPVQAYAPLSSVKTADTAAMMYEGWPNSTSTLSGPTPPVHPHGHGLAQSFGLSHAHSCNHSHHAHSHDHL
ncbi:LOW QUALITY PROTEIN: rhomboid domain-containing protein 2 [Lates calcarifer]|uniref:LOW QUALITY PROTEIN: rhomboid domain-containing protein 2 n=1 Tax=Lates calcarifer TaxID=8187 RepID=A0AAJ7LDG5_LATCA|nr:LOW QUALITY PROTEIN: rhomboid domain-containing protein 2 [Lates calcarifer]